MADNSSMNSLRTYMKHAFTFRWNLLFFIGGAAAAIMSPWPDALLPILGGVELLYLTGLSTLPKFRTAIDAKLAAEAREKRLGGAASAPVQASLAQMLSSLPLESLARFNRLRQRCYDMRDIASGVRGQTAGAGDSADAIRTPALDRLLFLFLKLLMSQAGLNRFLKTTSEKELSLRTEDIRIRLTTAQTANEERMVKSLQDNLADAELRLDNYKKSLKDSEFVATELDRIETKIQALVEMGVSKQDPDSLSHQVTAAAESMQQTEETVNQLQHLTGLADQLAETPAILESNAGREAVRAR